ncbi:MAG: molybdenum cofactor guanylyltransferase [Pseudomonadota bacterium]
MRHDDDFDDVTGVILAGGRSSRMGRDKAMLKVGEETFFDRILRLMQSFFPQVIIAGNRPDLMRPGVPYYPDNYPGSALGGLYTGLFAAQTEKIFVSSCDIPFPSPDIIRIILSERGSFDVVVPKTPDGFEPLFGLYHKNCLPPMRDMLERKEYCVFDFYPLMRVRYLSVAELPPDWRWSLMNVNTPEELNSLRESVRRRTDSGAYSRNAVVR